MEMDEFTPGQLLQQAQQAQRLGPTKMFQLLLMQKKNNYDNNNEPNLDDVHL